DSGATVVWRQNNAEQDAEAIHGAIKGWGTNEGKLIEILGTRTSHQRKEISAAYNRKYGNPNDPGRSAIIDDLEGDTKGTFEDILVQLTYSIEELLAKEIHESLHRRKDWTFLEIICTSDKNMLDRIRAAYVA
ncbi:annexin B10-like, partial [Nilaparvata lugens]|uniref:annexin B10-like n=1 Tax=Nilaparvata lugens TaxID=108931 RepID=UPI00193E250A